LIYLFSFLWHEILVLIFNMFIYIRSLVIQFVEMHCTRMHQIFIDLHPGYNCDLFIELFTNRHCLQLKKNNYSIFISIVAIWLWGLRNNNLFYNLFQFLTFVLYFHYLHRIYIELEVGPFDKLAETYFFCWRLHKYELLQFVWY
jgi:hypothetical protein